MERVFDFEFDFEEEDGLLLFPEGTEKEEGGGTLYFRLPNGKYAPKGAYKLPDGATLIYEPKELDMAAWIEGHCTISGGR